MVSSYNRRRMLLKKVQAWAWVWAIPYHVSQAPDGMEAPVACGVSQDSLECFQIAVDVPYH